MSLRSLSVLVGAAGLALSAWVLASQAAPETSRGQIVGMRRLTEAQYRRSVADIFSPAIKIQGRFEPEVRRDRLIAVGSGEATISASGMEQYYAIATSIGDQVTGPAMRAQFVPCKPKQPKAADPACARAFLAKYGRQLYRRPLSDAEMKALSATADRVALKAGDFHVGLSETLAAMLTSPNFLFRIERASGLTADGLARLDDHSRASRLSFLLWNASPDPKLLAAADRGELSTAAGLRRQVDRMVASPRLADGTAAFFDDMLQLDAFKTQTKDAQRFPKYSQVLAEDARQQTLKTLVNALIVKDGDYRDVFTTRDTFLTRALALVYKVPYASNAAWAPYTFDASSGRSGVLTDISFLSLFGHPAESSPTKRGVALNEIFLCQTTPSPPGNVDFSAVNGAGPDRLKTVRLRLSKHATDRTCAACHTMVDPPGLSLERFDTLGQYRETEDGERIDVHSEIGGVKFEGAQGLGRVLHDNPRTSQCLVRNLIATGTGRAVTTPADRKIADGLTKTFVDGGYRLPQFLTALATGEALYTAPVKPIAAPPQKVASAAPVRSQESPR